MNISPFAPQNDQLLLLSFPVALSVLMSSYLIDKNSYHKDSHLPVYPFSPFNNDTTIMDMETMKNSKDPRLRALYARNLFLESEKKRKDEQNTKSDNGMSERTKTKTKASYPIRSFPLKKVKMESLDDERQCSSIQSISTLSINIHHQITNVDTCPNGKEACVRKTQMTNGSKEEKKTMRNDEESTKEKEERVNEEENVEGSKPSPSIKMNSKIDWDSCGLSFSSSSVLPVLRLIRHFGKWGKVTNIHGSRKCYNVLFGSGEARDAALLVPSHDLGTEIVECLRGKVEPKEDGEVPSTSQGGMKSSLVTTVTYSKTKPPVQVADAIEEPLVVQDPPLEQASHISMPCAPVWPEFDNSFPMEELYGGFAGTQNFSFNGVEVNPCLVCIVGLVKGYEQMQSLNDHILNYNGKLFLHDTGLNEVEASIVFPNGMKTNYFMYTSTGYFPDLTFTIPGKLFMRIAKCKYRGNELLYMLEKQLNVRVIDYVEQSGAHAPQPYGFIRFSSHLHACDAIHAQRITFPLGQGHVEMKQIHKKNTSIEFEDYPHRWSPYAAVLYKQTILHSTQGGHSDGIESTREGETKLEAVIKVTHQKIELPPDAMCYLMINNIPIHTAERWAKRIERLGNVKKVQKILSQYNKSSLVHHKLFMQLDKALQLLNRSPVDIDGISVEIDIPYQVILKVTTRELNPNILWEELNKLYGPTTRINTASLFGINTVIFFRIQDARAFLKAGGIEISGEWHTATESTTNLSFIPFANWVEENEEKMNKMTSVEILTARKEEEEKEKKEVEEKKKMMEKTESDDRKIRSNEMKRTGRRDNSTCDRDRSPIRDNSWKKNDEGRYYTQSTRRRERRREERSPSYSRERDRRRREKRRDDEMRRKSRDERSRSPRRKDDNRKKESSEDTQDKKDVEDSKKRNEAEKKKRNEEEERKKELETLAATNVFLKCSATSTEDKEEKSTRLPMADEIDKETVLKKYLDEERKKLQEETIRVTQKPNPILIPSTSSMSKSAEYSDKAERALKGLQAAKDWQEKWMREDEEKRKRIREEWKESRKEETEDNYTNDDGSDDSTGTEEMILKIEIRPDHLRMTSVSTSLDNVEYLTPSSEATTTPCSSTGMPEQLTNRSFSRSSIDEIGWMNESTVIGPNDEEEYDEEEDEYQDDIKKKMMTIAIGPIPTGFPYTALSRHLSQWGARVEDLFPQPPSYPYYYGRVQVPYEQRFSLLAQRKHIVNGACMKMTAGHVGVCMAVDHSGTLLEGEIRQYFKCAVGDVVCIRKRINKDEEEEEEVEKKYTITFKHRKQAEQSIGSAHIIKGVSVDLIPLPKREWKRVAFYCDN